MQYKKICLLLCLFITVLCLAGCGAEKQKEQSGGVEVKDYQGTTVKIPKKPERILTLSIYSDEMVLGMVPSSKLVAISKFLDDPKESVVVEKAKRVPEKVTDPSVEQIMGWKPDIIIANTWTNMEKVTALRELGFPVVVIGPGNSYADIQGDIRLIAQSISEEEKGQQIIAKMDEIRDDIVKKVEKIPPEKRKSVTLLSVMRQYGGAGSAFDDMCRLTGVRNAIAEVGVKNGQVLTKELLVKSNPDYILLPSYDDKGTFDIDAFIASYLEDPSLSSMRAIQNRALIFPRESYIYNSSQDFVFGMQELAYVVYGDEFAQEPNRHISFSGEE